MCVIYLYLQSLCTTLELSVYCCMCPGTCSVVDASRLQIMHVHPTWVCGKLTYPGFFPPQESDLQREATMSAIQTIRAISNWLYWQTPIAKGTSSKMNRKLLLIPQKSTQSTHPNIDKLRDAASARKQSKPNRKVSSNYTNNDEYWVPSLVLPEAAKNNSASTTAPESPPKEEPKKLNNENIREQKIENTPGGPFSWGAPIVAATVAAVIVRLQIGTESAGGIKDHMGGSLLVDIVNSSWLQVILAGTTWYLIGMAVVELVEALGLKIGGNKK